MVPLLQALYEALEGRLVAINCYLVVSYDRRVTAVRQESKSDTYIHSLDTMERDSSTCVSVLARQNPANVARARLMNGHEAVSAASRSTDAEAQQQRNKLRRAHLYELRALGSGRVTLRQLPQVGAARGYCRR